MFKKKKKRTCFVTTNTNINFRGVQGGALYLFAGVVSAESDLGHLHLEVVTPFPSALWEQRIVLTPESKAVGQIQNQTKDVREKKKKKETHFLLISLGIFGMDE